MSTRDAFHTFHILHNTMLPWLQAYLLQCHKCHKYHHLAINTLPLNPPPFFYPPPQGCTLSTGIRIMSYLDCIHAIGLFIMGGWFLWLKVSQFGGRACVTCVKW